MCGGLAPYFQLQAQSTHNGLVYTKLRIRSSVSLWPSLIHNDNVLSEW